MNIRLLNQSVDEETYTRSVYKKDLILDDKKGKVYLGYADSCGKIVSDGCIWIKKNGAEIYQCFIIESQFNRDNQNDLQDLINNCKQLLNLID